MLLCGSLVPFLPVDNVFFTCCNWWLILTCPVVLFLSVDDVFSPFACIDDLLLPVMLLCCFSVLSVQCRGHDWCGWDQRTQVSFCCYYCCAYFSFLNFLCGVLVTGLVTLLWSYLHVWLFVGPAVFNGSRSFELNCWICPFPRNFDISAEFRGILHKLRNDWWSVRSSPSHRN